MSAMLPPPFIRQMQTLLGSEWPLLEAALQETPPVSVRLNPRRIPTFQSLELGPDRVPWHPYGYYLPQRPVFTLDPTFHAGAYYVQEASSMFVREALIQTVDFTQPIKILDLCAAPGGKSTLIADLIQPHSLLIANEAIRARTAPLRENLERWGVPNIAVTSGEVEEFAAMENTFDVILADAPCSGEGLFRKDLDARKEWSLPHVELCAARQKRILAAAVQALAPGGIILFSTCTYNDQENDQNLRWLAQSFELESIDLEIPAEWGVRNTAGGGYQFYPHLLKGEGFFISVFRKKTQTFKRLNAGANYKQLKPLPKSQAPEAAAWLHPKADARFFLSPSNEVLALPAALDGDYLLLDKFLKTKWFGLNIGEFKGKDFVPGHALALSDWASPELPGIDLDRDQALLFLKKESFDPPAGAAKGWAVVRYAGLNLGWVKILPNRLNNYLPQERRIRMNL